MEKIVVAYIPVLHEGYKLFLEKHSNARSLYIFGNDIIGKFDYLSKEIRALKPLDVQKAVQSWDIIKEVVILEKQNIHELSGAEIIMPDEDVCRLFAEETLKGEFVAFDPVFLRWDRTNTKREKKVGPEKVITENEFMNSAFTQSEKSSDWWRRVGAVLVKDGEIVLSRSNEHLPSPHTPYVDGDPRNVSRKGEDLDFFTSIHAEAGVIAEAAKKGIKLDGAEMYATDFPCPVCAKQIACAGIKKLYFYRGYGVLDGERVLKQHGVEIVQVGNM